MPGLLRLGGARLVGTALALRETLDVVAVNSQMQDRDVMVDAGEHEDLDPRELVSGFEI